MDLVGRKIAREGGATAAAWVASLKRLDAELSAPALQGLRRQLAIGANAVADCVEFIVSEKNPLSTFAGAVPFLKLMGIVAGGWQMARAAMICERQLAAGQGDKSFHEAKLATARFYGDHVLVQASGLRDTVVNGGAGVMALSEDQFLAA
jgi:butyryl-CoA dehydrogenase